METYTSFRGVDIGPAETFNLTIPMGTDIVWGADVQTSARAGRIATYQGVTPQIQTREISIAPGSAAAGGDYDEWRQAAIALFNPFLGPATLVADFDGAERQITALVSLAKPHPQLPMRADRETRITGTMLFLDQYWRSTTTQTDTSSTTTNGGNAPASPKITIRPTTGTVLRRRVTLTENTGRGLVNHPLLLTVNTTGASVAAGSDLLLFDRGKSVLFQSQNLNNASTKWHYLCSLLPSEVGFVDALYGSAINNTITANKLDPAGFDWAHASWTNTNWVYRNTPGTLNSLYAPAIWEVSRQPKRPGAWHVMTPTPQESIAAGTESVSLTGTAAITVISQIAMAATASIIGFDSNAAWQDAFAQYRTAGSRTFKASESASIEESIDTPGAVQVYLWANGVSTILDQKDTATPIPIQIALQSGEVPTISVGSAVTMARINGRLTNTTTGDYIDFTDVYIDADASGGLVIDTNAAPGEKLRVYPSLSTSPLYCPHDIGWQFSNRAGFPLVPGANAWTWTGDGSPVITFEFQDTWV